MAGAFSREHAIPTIGTFILLMSSWELAVWWFAIPKIILPAPSSIAVSLWDGVVHGTYLWHSAVTFWEVVAGFVIGSATGLVLGTMIGLSPFLERTLYPYVVGFQTLPKVAVAPLFVVWFGYGATSKIIITATIAFFPLLANTIVGLRAAPRDQVDLMVAFTANRWQVFRMVRLPQAMPYVFAGLDVAAVLSVIGAIVGEFVGAQAGLGFLIQQATFNFDISGVFAILIILAGMGIGLHLAVVKVQKRVVFWMDTDGDRPVTLQSAAS